MRSTVQRLLRSERLLGVSFLVLGAFVLCSLLLLARQQGDGAKLRATLGIELQLANVLSIMQDEAIGQRGYLLTGDERFLTPYNDAIRQLARKLSDLETAIGGDPALSADLLALRALSDRKTATLAEAIALYRGGRTGEAIDLVRRGFGNDLIDQVRQHVEAMDARTDRMVAEQGERLVSVGIAAAVVTALALLLMGLVAMAALEEVRRRARLTRFLAPQIAARIAEGDEALRRGRTGPVAIAFVDMRDSTGFAETRSPEEFSVALTTLREAVSGAAAAHEGMVDKFIGDGALVVFGALGGEQEASRHAIAFAHDLLARIERARAPFSIGIGLHRGDAFCGVIGTSDRHEFTVLGDTVNVAAKVEKATRQHGLRLVASEVLLRHAGEPVAAWRSLGCEPLGGRRGAIALYADLRIEAAVAPPPTAPAPSA